MSDQKIRFLTKKDCAEAAKIIFRKNKWAWWCVPPEGGTSGLFIPFIENIERCLSQLEDAVMSEGIGWNEEGSCAGTGRLKVGVDDKGLYYAIVVECETY